MASNNSLFQRTMLASQGLLLPWLGAAALLVGLDYLQPLSPESWAQTAIRMGKLYFMAGFAYAAWSQMAGLTDDPLVKRFFVGSLWLFAYYFVMGVAVNIAGSVLAMPLMYLGAVVGSLAVLLLTAAQNIIMTYFLAAAAGRDFIVGVQSMRALFMRTRKWALGMALANPGLAVLGGIILSRMDQSLSIPGAVAVTLVQNLLTLFLLMGVTLCRVDMDQEMEAQAIQAEQESPTPTGSDEEES